jgi:hypothetical protein
MRRYYIKKCLAVLRLSRFILIFQRYRIVKKYYKEKFWLIFYWCFKKTENSNFYYDLTEQNRLYLEHFVVQVTGVPVNLVCAYFDELLSNETLKNHIRRSLVSSSYDEKIDVKFGRRIGWYAIARITKPKVIVETGVEHGVGACVLIEALFKNKEEGFFGKYVGTDIDLNAGQLLNGKYLNLGEILFGDSIESLRRLDEKIDLFINDSDHSSDYEYREYMEVVGKLSPNAIIIGDNSHISDSLAKFSVKNSRNFLFFKEEPKSHWYPGGGIGISFKTNV